MGLDKCFWSMALANYIPWGQIPGPLDLLIQNLWEWKREINFYHALQVVIQHTCAWRNTGWDLIAVTPEGVDTQNGMNATQWGGVTEDMGESHTHKHLR